MQAPLDDMKATPEFFVGRALSRERDALRSLVEALTPIVRTRVARVLLRRAPASSGRNIRQEVEDLTQEVFVALFAHDGRMLRAWEPQRGLSLENFVGFIAERQVTSILRTARRSPWTEDPTQTEALDGPDDRASVELRLASRQELEMLLDRMREELSPLGLSLFEQLYLQQRSAAEVCARTGMSRDAVYAWQSRLGRLVRRLGAEITSNPQAMIQ
jgi:RNA polymerase sigma factor (sigma-70 family)